LTSVFLRFDPTQFPLLTLNMYEIIIEYMFWFVNGGGCTSDMSPDKVGKR
jgi:hypothetical protein